MLRLKSRSAAPPGGFLYEQKQTGWRNWLVAPTTQWDFNALCTALQAHRRANPQFKLQTNLTLIQSEVDTANAMRVAAMPNTESYVYNDNSPIPKAEAPSTLDKLQSVAGAVKKVSAGADVLLAWERSGDKPVDQAVADDRAITCGRCPRNGKGDLTRWFTMPAAALIRKHIERLHDLKLSTPFDQHLGVCEACSCPLKLKVHTPIKFVLGALNSEILAELQPENPRCWILEEKERYERSLQQTTDPGTPAT